MPSFHYPSKRGFTLSELVASVFLVLIIGMILYPVFAKPGKHRSQTAGITRQKILALAFIQYIQDYDERFPPAIGYKDMRSQTVNSSEPPNIVAQSWGPSYTLKGGRIVPGILSGYAFRQDNTTFLDPDDKQSKRRHRILEFMYNDLITTQEAELLSSPANTVLLTSGDNRLENAGHALTPNSGSFPATFNTNGGCDAGKGASVREARLRYNGGTFFAFADGHVRWFKGSKDDKVFFPSRSSASRSAFDPQTQNHIGPLPGPKMRFQGRQYQATFHIR